MTKAQKLVQGITIISKYESDVEMAADHDIIYCGQYRTDFSPEDLLALESLGWFKSEDSWAIFI